MRRKTWFAASIVIGIERLQGRQRVFPIEESVVLLRATSPEEAIARAAERGLEEATATSEGLTWNGRPARLRFLAVRKVVLCFPDTKRRGPSDVVRLHDGVEATSSRYVARSRRDVTAFLKGKPVTLRVEE